VNMIKAGLSASLFFFAFFALFQAHLLTKL
jgi:hypothetical protein